MIRNVVIHVENEQPLLADLYSIPSAADAGLLCTNVRTMDGKRPVFIDETGSTFFFPYHVVRFLEITTHSMAAWQAAGGQGAPTAVAGAGRAGTGGAGEGTNGTVDSADAPGSLLPIPLGAPDSVDGEDLEVDLEIDEDFLQRVRDI